MTYLQLARNFDPMITSEQLNMVMMEETAYPFCDIKMFIYQLRAAIRRHKNGINGCELCGDLKCRCEEKMKEAGEKHE